MTIWLSGLSGYLISTYFFVHNSLYINIHHTLKIDNTYLTFSGIPIKSTLDNSTSVQYAGLIQQLADKARSVVRDLDPSNDLMFLRMRTKKHEIMVAPGKFS